MKITKRNGNTTLYDETKVARSILRANQEVSGEEMTEVGAARIADEVFSRLTEHSEIITTREIRDCLFTVLCERGYVQTAEHYRDFRK